MTNNKQRQLWRFWRLFIAALLLAAVTGCSAAPAPSSEPEGDAAGSSVKERTITMMTNRVDLIESGKMQQYAERFEQMHPGTHVQFEGIMNYAADIMVKLSTRNMSDVLLLPTNLLLQDLPRYFEPLDDAMFDGIRFADYKSYNGKRYGMTTGASTVGIVYNKEAFAKAGITELPRTLSEFYEACRKLKDAGITPVFLNYGARWPMKQWGDELVSYMTGDPQYLNNMASSDAPWQLDNAWGQSMMIVKKLIDNGYTESNLMSNQWESSKKQIAAGKAAMYLSGNWVIQQIIDAGGSPDQIGFFPFPYDDAANHYAPLLPDWFVGVSKFSENKELAKAWIEFYVKESGYIEDSGFLPIAVSKEPTLRQFKQFMSFSPTLIENESPSEQFLAIVERAQIPFMSGEYIQEWVVADDLEAKFNLFNEKWKLAREGG